MSSELKERVQAGIKFLDENYPGWYNKIDLKILDLSEFDKCICGQLGIDSDIDELDRTLPMNEKLGFYTRNFSFPELNEIWEKEIIGIRKYENDKTNA